MLPFPVLAFAANDAPTPALPPLLPAPRTQDLRHVSSNVLPPPALRMGPTNSSTLGPLFAPVVGTFASPLDVLRPNSLQIVPPLTPAYMAMQQPPSAPVGHVTGASTWSSFQTVRPAVSVSNYPRPPPLQLHVPHAPTQSSRPLTASFQMMRPASATISSVQPPPLRFQCQNTSRYTAEQMLVPSCQSVRAVLTVASTVRPPPPPLRIRLSYTAPHTTAAAAAAANFSCFTLVSTKSTVVSCLPHGTVAQSQKSTSSSCSLVSSAPRRTSSAANLNADVIDVDEDSSSSPEPAASDECDETTAVTASVIDSSCNVVDVVSSSSSTAASRTDTVVLGHSARQIFPHSNSPIQPLHAGVDCLQHIFQYLDISARLRAAQVCRCWHRMALQQNLVNSVLFFCINRQLYTVSQKRDLYTFAHNFARC